MKIENFCECGCGHFAKLGNKFINGHNLIKFQKKGRVLSQEHKENLSRSKLALGGNPLRFNINEEGCYICISHKVGASGYPYIYRNGISISAVKYLWEQKYGKAPKEICFLHKCDNRLCINPDHIFLGTKTDNAKDRDSKLRQAYGSRNGMAKLKEKDVLEIFHDKSSYPEISLKFGISEGQIERIKNKECWKILLANV